MMTWNQWGFQDALSPVMEEFLFFHDFAMMVLSFITVFVFVVLWKSMMNKFLCSTLLEGQMIECIWTIVPAFILIQLAVPSLTLLYMLDETVETQISMKAIGHQWYWSYEMTDLWGEGPYHVSDSYLLAEDSQTKITLRLLDVDNRVTLPMSSSVRVLVTSLDVIHSWVVPSLGVKVDAMPGRLNQVNFISYRPGLFFGQCSEICGANHSFMPIAVEFITPFDFFWWNAQ